MKNVTIWESASRPLFVRTVWLEGSELRRGLQRHFLLDYDTRRPLERLSSARNPKANSLDLNDFTDFDEDEAKVLLVGSAKVKLHEPNKKAKVFKYRRRSSLVSSRQYPNYNSSPFTTSKYLSRRPSNVSESYSRKNSLLPPQQHTVETSQEFLAERVLNWLDLAGNTDILRNPQELKELNVKRSKTSKLRPAVIKSSNTRVQNSQKTKQEKQNTKPYQPATTDGSAAVPQFNHKPSKAVKQITIVFNKEGQPMHFNGPVKTIGLWALPTSPKTKCRLAGKLSPGRLFKSAEIPRYWSGNKKPYLKCKTSNEGNKCLSAHKRLETVADLTNSAMQKRLHEHAEQDSYNNLHESKKQLHIFMPSLPKEGLVKSVCGTEDGMSELSHNFSELCRI